MNARTALVVGRRHLRRVADDAFVDVGFDVVIRVACELDATSSAACSRRSERIVAGAVVLGEARHAGHRRRPRPPPLPALPVSPDEQRQDGAPLRHRRERRRRGRRLRRQLDGPLIGAAVAGLGITVMAASVVHDELLRGDLVRVLPDAKLEPVEIWALHPWRRRAPPRARVVIDAIAAERRRSPAFAHP